MLQPGETAAMRHIRDRSLTCLFFNMRKEYEKGFMENATLNGGKEMICLPGFDDLS